VTQDEVVSAEAKAAVAGPRSRRVPLALAGLALLVLASGALLMRRALSGTSDVALSSMPKGVTATVARDSAYRPLRRYVGAIAPWVSARVGPQLVSAYVQTVLVRPGDRVRRGQVLATLDCRNTSALSRSIGMQAKALEETQVALSKEAARVQSLLAGGFVSSNEVEQKTAESASKQSQLLGLKAQQLGTDLQVSDCVLRAPFDGEIGERMADPGAFVRPGSALVTEVDLTTLRVTADVPESDFEAVVPGSLVKLHLLATGARLQAVISRRSPAADEETRTIHVEIDLPNPESRIPGGTTADLLIDVGAPQPAFEVPLSAASVRGDSAVVMTVRDGVARQRSVRLLGERDGRLFLDPSLGRDTLVVTEGRAALVEGDAVTVRETGTVAPAPEAGPALVGDGHDRAAPPPSAKGPLETRTVRP
jgi:membrane fusion protein, multidrug efflux system